MINVNDKLIKEDLPKIGCEAFGVLMAITIHINSKRTAFPKVPRLMQLTGLSRNKVYKAIAVLIDNGYLARWQQKENTQFGKVFYRVTTKYLSIYMAVDEVEMESSDPLTHFGDTENGDTHFGDTENGETVSINKEGSIKNGLSIKNGEGISDSEESPPLFYLEEKKPKRKAAAKNAGGKFDSGAFTLAKSVFDNSFRAFQANKGLPTGAAEGVYWSPKEIGQLTNLIKMLRHKASTGASPKIYPTDIDFVKQALTPFLEIASRLVNCWYSDRFTPTNFVTNFEQIYVDVKRHVKSGYTGDKKKTKEESAMENNMNTVNAIRMLQEDGFYDT